jgi:predicted nucleotidyltransferase
MADDLLDAIRDYVNRQPEVDAAYLFGSRAKGKERAASDVDVALLVDEGSAPESTPAYRLEQIMALEDICGRPADVVILNDAPLVLRHQILKYGRLIYERDHRRRVDFEVQSLQAYFDFKPILDRLNQRLLQDIKEGKIATRYRGHRDPLSDARRALERLEGRTTG